MRTVYVVPHTHWDREWYQPHELFRWRLVHMIDELLDLLEGDPAFRCFNLDGQTIVIDDYLELRPENEGRLRALIEAGCVLIGPWWVQPDEFLPTGESHIRSFQKGIRRAQRLGGSLRIGHCADQFGHIAQMPQIMSGLGLTSACLWRGVPDTVPGWSFWWEAPDGTRLPVLYLRNSYSSGWRIPRDPGELVERVRRQEEGRRDEEPALLMAGTDHSRAEPHLPASLAAASGRGYDFRLATLHEYEAAMREAGFDEHVHAGELRSPDRSNVLVGVLSARNDIKKRDFEVSSALERYTEPLELLARLHGGPDGLPALRQAWRLLLENSPHDSICGCSVDQTHREMFPRYDRAEQLAREVARESVAALAARVETPPGGALLVFRPVPFAPAVLQAEVAAGWEGSGLALPGGTVVPAALGPPGEAEVLQHHESSAGELLEDLESIREGRININYLEGAEWELAGRHLAVSVTVGQEVAVFDFDAFREGVREVVRDGLADTAELTVLRSARRTLRAVLPPTDSIGLQVAGPAPSAPASDIAVTRRCIANAFYQVRWRQGRLLVRDWQNGIDIRGASTFVDEGDRGDEYSADILPDAILQPSSAELLAVDCDDVSASLRYRLALDVPARLNRRRTARLKRRPVPLPLDVTVTLWAGLPRVDFRVIVDNQARDHRLRALFPLPFGVTTVHTENQFHVGERSLTPPPWNGRSPEQPPTTFPQKTFAALEDGGLGMAVLNRGLQEGEVVRDRKGRQAYALTLLRCVGWLSRPDLVSRRGGAGPTIATFDSQQHGRHTFEYALTSYRGTWRSAGVQPLAHSFAHPPLAFATNQHPGSLREEVPLLALSHPSVVPSAMHRSDLDGAPVVRVYSAAAAPFQAELRMGGRPGAAATMTDLLERPIGEPEARDGTFAFGLRPWQIATLRLEPPTG